MGSRCTLLDMTAANVFWCNFANTDPRNLIQHLNRCVMYWKSISKIIFISNETLSKFDFLDTVTWKVMRTMEPEQSDKRDIRPGLQNGQGWGDFFSHGHLPQLNSVGSGAHWIMGLFSLWNFYFKIRHPATNNGWSSKGYIQAEFTLLYISASIKIFC